MPCLPNPYSQAILDFWRGDTDASYTIHRDDGFSQAIPVAASFDGPPFSPIDQLALGLCSGKVLDVGAGVGRHSLFLQERGFQVTAIEILPELVDLMSARGVVAPMAESLFSLEGQRFDTIVMLMNGFGLVGSLSRAGEFFEQAGRILNNGGQILCDSLDVSHTRNVIHLAYQEANCREGRPPGQMRFWIEYRGQRGEPFDWLHLDFDGLGELARRHAWKAELMANEENGHYLARLVRG